MRTITFASSFKRAYKSLLRKHPDLKPKVDAILKTLAATPFGPTLQTHKLKGQLAASWACSVEYAVGSCLTLLKIPNREQRKFY